MIMKAVGLTCDGVGMMMEALRMGCDAPSESCVPMARLV